MNSEVVGEQIREAVPHGTAAKEVRLLDLLIILSRRRKFIFRATLASMTLAVITVVLIPNQYKAETVVLPPSQSSVSSAILSQLGAAGGGLASLASGGLGMKNTNDMYVSFLRGRTVEDSVIQHFGLLARYHAKRMSDARKKLENHSTVALGVKDGLIRISVEDRDPKIAAQIANGYVDELRKLCANLAITEASQRRLFFQQQLLEARNNLTDAEEAMKHTEQTTGVLQIDSQARLLIESAATLRAQAVAKEIQIQAMRSFATEDNPELIVAKRQLAELQSQLDKLAGQNSGSDFIVPKGKVPEAGMEYLRKLREVKYNETIFELIAKQFEVAKLDEARQGAVIQVVDVAVVPDKKSSPMRAVIVIVVTLIAFVIALFLVLLEQSVGVLRQNPENRSRIESLTGIWGKSFFKW